MMRVILITSSIVLTGGYLWSALVGLVVGLRLRLFRGPYWVSIPMCLMLASYQIVRLVQGQPGDTLSLFARGAALGFVYCRTIRPIEKFSAVLLEPHEGPSSDPGP